MAVIHSDIGGDAGHLNTGTAGLCANIASYPVEAGTAYRFGSNGSALVNLTGPSTVFGLKNEGSTPLIIRRISMSAFATVNGAPQYVDWGLIVARSWTGSMSGGSVPSVTPSQSKQRNTPGAGAFSLRWSTGSAVNVSTATIDTNYQCQFGTYMAAVGTRMEPFDIYKAGSTGYPLVMAKEEGILLRNINTISVSITIRAYLNVEWFCPQDPLAF